jgi:hypothetical protein
MTKNPFNNQYTLKKMKDRKAKQLLRGTPMGRG